MTWSNETQAAIVSRCPFMYHFSDNIYSQQGYTGTHSIPFNTSGPDLNCLTCKRFNQQGTQCREYRDGYEPAAFSDGFPCAGCSRYPYLTTDYGDPHILTAWSSCSRSKEFLVNSMSLSPTVS